MRFLIRLGVLALAAYGAKQLYDRWEPTIRSTLAQGDGLPMGLRSAPATEPDIDLTAPPANSAESRSEERAVDDIREELQAST